MRYFIRSVKYFIYIMIILALVILVLMFANLVEKDFSKVFVNGYNSLWQIALVLAAFSALYPNFGYTKRTAHLYANPAEAHPIIKKVMDNRSYKLEKQDGDTLYFIKRYPFDRAMKLWEDRISVHPCAGGWELEGLTREVVRLVSAMEAQINED